MSAGGNLYAYFLLLPLITVSNWLTWIKQQPPGQQELAKACHGVGMLVLLVWLVQGIGVSGTINLIADHADNPLYWLIPCGMAAWGIGWFLLNARIGAQAMGSHRPTMIVRALVKIVVGVALRAYAQNAPDLWNWFAALLSIAAIWCLATGITKLALTIWGARGGHARDMVERDIADREFDWDKGIRR